MTKYSQGFNEMFDFFLKSYRYKLLDFCGSEVVIRPDMTGIDAKKGFKLYENGKLKDMSSRHNNILQGVIIGKKAWGLWLQQYTDGISDFLFTKKEIFEEFEKLGIKVPEKLMIDFDNVLEKKQRLKFEQNKLWMKY